MQKTQKPPRIGELMMKNLDYIIAGFGLGLMIGTLLMQL